MNGKLEKFSGFVLLTYSLYSIRYIVHKFAEF